MFVIDSVWQRLDTQQMSTQPEAEFVPEWTDGDKLRKVRRHLGMTQAEFARALQVNPITYSGWESDRNRIKDLRAIARRIKAMTGTPLWWWFDTERPDRPNGPDDGGSPLPGSNRGPLAYLVHPRPAAMRLAGAA